MTFIIALVFITVLIDVGNINRLVTLVILVTLFGFGKVSGP